MPVDPDLVALDPDLVALLRHPETHEPVRAATGGELAAVNARLAAKAQCQPGGDAPAEPLAEGLVAPAEGVLFPVRDGFPIMLTEAAIPLPREAQVSPADAR